MRHRCKYFNDDADFAEYAIVPVVVVRKLGDMEYTDFDFTNDYINDCNNGVHFIIADPKSRIAKDNLITYKTITKKIKNIDEYYGW